MVCLIHFIKNIFCQYAYRFSALLVVPYMYTADLKPRYLCISDVTYLEDNIKVYELPKGPGLDIKLIWPEPSDI